MTSARTFICGVVCILRNGTRCPIALRREGLDRMIERYRHVLMNPRIWDAMRRRLGLVPQPIRTVAYREMVAYWAGHYDVGANTACRPRRGYAGRDRDVRILARSSGKFVNRDGSRDLGPGGASDFARERLRQLFARAASSISRI